MPAKVQAVPTALGSNASRAVTFAAAVAGNGLLIPFGCQNNSAAQVNTPAGWSKILQTAVGTATLTWFWKVAVGGETSVTITTTNAGTNQAHLFEFSGIDPTNPIDTGALYKDDDEGAVNALSLGPTPATASRAAIAVSSLWVQAGAGVGTATASDGFDYTQGLNDSAKQLASALKSHSGGVALSTSLAWGNAATSPRAGIVNVLGPAVAEASGNELILGIPF